MESGSGATLLIRGGPNSGVTVQLSGHAITIGRRSDNDVVIDETTVSRRHSLIMEAADGFSLRDLNTTNGTFVNRIKIGQTEYPLRHGDQISLGGSEVTLVFRLEGPRTRPVDTDSVRERAPAPGQAKVLGAEQATFEEDLEVDSLGVVELLMALEDNFGVAIPDEEAEAIGTVGAAVDVVMEKLGG